MSDMNFLRCTVLREGLLLIVKTSIQYFPMIAKGGHTAELLKVPNSSASACYTQRSVLNRRYPGSKPEIVLYQLSPCPPKLSQGQNALLFF